MRGTIRERCKADGTRLFTCQVEIGRDPATGKRRYKTGTAKTKREADALVRRLLRDAETESANTERATTARTLGELIERWLEVGGPCAPSTRLVYAGYIRGQIKPHIAGIRLDRLKVTDTHATTSPNKFASPSRTRPMTWHRSHRVSSTAPP